MLLLLLQLLPGYYFNKAIQNCEVDIHVSVLNSTKNTATVQIQLRQQQQLKSQYIGTFGTLANMKGPSHMTMYKNNNNYNNNNNKIINNKIANNNKNKNNNNNSSIDNNN